MAQVSTLSLKNLFTFDCPVFAAETQMRSCVALRNQVWQGKRPPVRKGCQAAMSGGKCPAAEIVRRFAFATGDLTEHCSSSEPKKGKLPRDVLERIRPTIIDQKQMQNFGASSAEIKLMLSANDRIDEQIKTAPKSDNARQQRIALVDEPKPKPRKKAVATKPAVNEAAQSGDLGAAISQ